MIDAIANYQIVAQLNESSDSLIYRAIQRRDRGDLPVILKVLKPDCFTLAELNRYEREYEILCSLNLEGTIKAYGLEEVEGAPILVLEDFGGISLKHWFRARQKEEKGGLDVREFLAVALKTTKVLDEIHNNNIIHKDINPSNIVLNPQTGVLKIIDFGISSFASEKNPESPSMSAIEGTLAYISPEQTGRMNRLLDYRTDFYSLGITFYELLTTELPFNADDPLELVHCHLAKSPPGLGVGDEDSAIARVLGNIVMKLMAKNAEERYQSARSLHADLETCLMQLETTGTLAQFPLDSFDSENSYSFCQLYPQSPSRDIRKNEAPYLPWNATTSTQSIEALDLAAVLRASQAISSEIELDKALGNLMKILMENAGAQFGFLILDNDGMLSIEAEGGAEGEVSVLQSKPIDGEMTFLSHAIVDAAIRTRESIVLKNAMREGAFTQERYIQKFQVKSVLCSPLLYRGQLVGVVYLENNLMAGTFTANRIEVIQLLSGQAAIALTNAKLFAEVHQSKQILTDYNATLEEKVAQRTQQLEQEIAERKQIDAALRLSEEKFAKAFRSSPNAITITTLEEGRHIEVNQTFCEFTEYATEEILGRTARELDLWVNLEERDRLFQHLVTEKSVYNYEFAFRTKTGNVKTALLSAEIINLYGQDCLLAISNDISHRKHAEAELQAKNEELSQTLQQLQTTQTGLIQSEKMAALGQLVAGIAHEINTPIGAIRASSGNITHAIEQSLLELPQLSQRLTPQEQDIFFSLLNRALSQNDAVSTSEKRKFKRALTRQLQEYQIENARRIADVLTDMGIYDRIEPFLTLLQTANTHWILQLTYNLARIQGNSRNILIAVERASKVVFALKTYARYDRLNEKQLASIEEGIELVLELYRNQFKQGIEIVRTYQSLPSIWCYPDELMQVWTNLIHNAIQAMDCQGRLEIEISECNLEGICQKSAHSVVVRITDSGCGIPEDLKDKIFEPFFTTKPLGEGSGLGLDIVQKIVQKHKGTIEVKTMPGNTTFSVCLPIEKSDEL
ncbi:protein kinase [Lusitaniella coriacea LEGE 07157]|uniref:histidine kinase n=1 Tax=Lusitaniella coriacea LEGE 07157 TaxID=945747 RepID=A0A8J7J9N0_9CYAN|nr:ATP-binding protein [Lusitaniella coriacea]MBE9115680.1 protein kinase [Lusitaniella coriacea LEGE 07157]